MKRVLIGASRRASDHVVGRPPGGRRHAEAGRRVAPPGDGVVSAQHRRGELQRTRVRLRHRQRGALPAHRGRPPGGRQVNHALHRRSRAAVKSHRATFVFLLIFFKIVIKICNRVNRETVLIAMIIMRLICSTT